jgi:hypothetical protein
MFTRFVISYLVKLSLTVSISFHSPHMSHFMPPNPPFPYTPLPFDSHVGTLNSYTCPSRPFIALVPPPVFGSVPTCCHAGVAVFGLNDVNVALPC